MLVIVSDLHLTDGTTGLRMPAGAFRVFRERLEDMAYDASKRDGDLYKPIEQFDLVLLGDIFDMLRTTQWTREAKGEPGYARPWSKLSEPELAQKVEQIVDAIMRKHAESLQILREMADGTAISLPPATRDKRVDRRVSRDPRSERRQPVKVNLHYMSGNHDWYFHIQGEPFERIRRKVVQGMGLVNPSGPFPHDPDESSEVQDIFARHQVFARHGDIYDPFNYVAKKGRDYSCLGDALVVELFNPLPELIGKATKNELPKAFYDDLLEMGSVRPSTMTPVWIASLLERYQVGDEHRKAINDVWREQVDHFLQVDFLRELDQPLFDIVDTVELMMKVFKTMSLERLDRLAPAVERLLEIHSAIWGGGEFGFDKNAAKEAAYESREARFIVYGHTHGFKVVPLRSTLMDGKPFDQRYINSGTWHPLHELGTEDPRQRSFIMHKTMSYLGFYHGDERKGRRYETWTGALDI